MASSERSALAYALGVLVALIAAGVGLFYVVDVFHLIPVSYSLIVRVLIALALGALTISLVGRIVRNATRRWMSFRRAGLVYSVYSLVAYVVLALVLLAVAGVNGVALLAGGTFAGLVLGLAGQTVLSNFIAGVTLLFVRPFGPGDRITLTTWQYSLIAPVYPPKFYSNDFLVPGYTGIVEELGLVYSRIRQDDGIRVRFPNNVLIQAAILSHDVAERWVRVKYEIPPTIDPERLIPRVEEIVRASDWVARPDSIRVWVHQATMGSYVVSVDALCKGSVEEPPRSALLIQIMKLVREMATASHPPTAPAASSGASRGVRSPAS